MLGVAVNFATVIVGALLGLAVKKILPDNLEDLVMKGMALCVIYIGIDGALEGKNALITVISMAVGAVIGGLLHLDDRLNRGAKKLESKLARKDGESGFAKGFTTATLLFCIGAMAIVGSLEAGLSGDNTTLYTKAVIDGITAVVLAASLGWGVIAAAIPVAVYQGLIVLLSSLVAPYLTDAIAEMTCAGSLLIIGIGLNMLGVTKIKLMDLMPAMFIPIILCRFM